ncbi:MAG TPA: spore cortex biosynthesis protein YabQ, partial [Coprococcus sp.]|nr:spore cortex biosynthesis protein YabQ [Coprococcus sp.]
MSDMAAGQLWGYGICVAAGVCSGVLGSLFWFISKLFRNSRAVAWICDITLWLILSVVVMAVSYICCDGDLRLYIFLGFFS